MRVRLIRKFAETIDGIDISHCRVGDVLELSLDDARILIAEGWAEAADTDVTCAAKMVAPKSAEALKRPRLSPRRRR
jgi:hypothetical protein